MVDRDVLIAISAKTYRAGMARSTFQSRSGRSDSALIPSARMETC
jgi:hypothetical protein